LNGVERTIEGEGDEEEVVIYRYPSRSLDELQSTRQAAVDLVGELDAYLERYQTQAERLEESEEVATRVSEGASLHQELSFLQDRIASTIIEAENQIARAEQLRQDYRDAIAAARDAIETLDVETANQAWNRAKEAYVDSLELMQDPEFRDQADQTVAAVGEEIKEARNRLVVRQVREMVNEAEQLYEGEQYIEAKNMLEDARETWSQTNVDPNPEIERLAGLVNVALNFTQQRDLSETEPLYPVLSNYLSIAREDYREAQRLLEAGDRDEAQSHLIRADENVDSVLAVRPYNWEARVLKLRILRQQNADNFADLFERRYEEALDVRDENPEEALTALETLKVIRPNYQGIDQQIRELEIELGLRPDPVTQQQRQEASRLLTRARELTEEGSAAQTRAAINLLEEAVSLNPENDEAKVLLDRLRIDTGGQATATLTSAEEQQLRRAETLFVENKVAQAFAIVERLMQEEENRLYPPLLDLRKRIVSRLGM
jgi:hypothetical protein